MMRPLDTAIVLAGMLITGVLTSLPARAADTPLPASTDSRMRVIDYDPQQVVAINILKGVGTRITLEPGEKIVSVAPGFGADCGKERDLWCIEAPAGGNDVHVKAKTEAKESNNLEVRTDRRSYTFDLILNPEFRRDRDAMFRVTFRYPQEESKARADAHARRVEEAQRLRESKPRNWAYSLEGLPGSEVITPTRVFDDGRFIRITFASNLHMPEVFAVEADGSESLVPTHVDQDTIVVQRLYRRLVLRWGKQAVGIWNDAFDAGAAPPPPAGAMSFLRRVLKGQP